MKIKLIMWGLIFFVNPVLFIFDILPTFIGAALILCGIYRIARFEERMYTARKDFAMLLYVSLARTLVMGYYMLPFAGAMIDESWILIFTMFFGVLEGIYMIRGFGNLIRSVDYLALDARIATIYNSKLLTKFRNMTIFFVVIRTIYSVMPELVTLTDTNQAGVNWRGIGFILTVFNIFIVMFIGIAWLRRGRQFMKMVHSHSDFAAHIEKRYQTDVIDGERELKFRVKNIMSLLLAGAVFSIPLRFDGIDLLPSFIGVGFFVAAFIVIAWEHKKMRRVFVTFGGAVFAFSAFEWIRNFLFVGANFNLFMIETMSFQEVIFGLVQHDPYIAREYNIIMYTAIFRAVLFIPIFFAAVVLLKKILLPTFTKSKSERQGELFSRLHLLCAMTVVSAGISVTYFLLFLQVPALWMLDFAFAALMVFLFYLTCDKINDAVDRHFLSIKRNNYVEEEYDFE